MGQLSHRVFFAFRSSVCGCFQDGDRRRTIAGSPKIRWLWELHFGDNRVEFIGALFVKRIVFQSFRVLRMEKQVVCFLLGLEVLKDR